jgi:hypothetical protein
MSSSWNPANGIRRFPSYNPFSARRPLFFVRMHNEGKNGNLESGKQKSEDVG